MIPQVVRSRVQVSGDQFGSSEFYAKPHTLGSSGVGYGIDLLIKQYAGKHSFRINDHVCLGDCLFILQLPRVVTFTLQGAHLMDFEIIAAQIADDRRSAP